MGIVRMGVSDELVAYLKKHFDIQYFVETGTGTGRSTVVGAKHFKKVFTIEFSKELYEKTSYYHRDLNNVDFLYGDSRKELGKIISKLDSPALFWLDAHWCSFGSYGENDQCPLLEEIELINTSRYEHFILIDDARLFLSPPPKPNAIEQYPDIVSVIDVLRRGHSRYIVVFEDVIIAVPQEAQKLLADYCHEENTKWWTTFGKEARKNDFIKSAELFLGAWIKMGRESVRLFGLVIKKIKKIIRNKYQKKA